MEPRRWAEIRKVFDEVLTQLTKIADLRVRGRHSTLAYATGGMPVSEIGEELRVGRIVRATVQRVGNQVRVHAQLIDARTEEQLWEESYHRDLTDVFTIQSEIATEIAAALHAQLTLSDRRLLVRAPPRDPRAYDLYLRARDYQLRGDHAEAQLTAEGLFRRVE
jgi:TolB-like protein